MSQNVSYVVDRIPLLQTLPGCRLPGCRPSLVMWPVMHAGKNDRRLWKKCVFNHRGDFVESLIVDICQFSIMTYLKRRKHLKWASFIEEIKKATIVGIDRFLPAATKLGQGNVFTGVCDSVHRGESASVHAGMPTPPSPGTRDPPPRPGRPPRDQRPPPRPGRHPPGKQTPAYSQWAAGTHPTGMHSCSVICLLEKCIVADSFRVISIIDFGCAQDLTMGGRDSLALI